MVNIVQQLCNISAVVLGLWHFGPKLDRYYSPWKTCPKSLAYFNRQTMEKAGINHVSDHPPKYSCLKNFYHIAQYETPSCLLFPISHSLKLISTHNSVKEEEFSVFSSQALSAASSFSSSLPKYFFENSSVALKDVEKQLLPTEPPSVKQKGNKFLGMFQSSKNEKQKKSKRILYIGDSLVIESYVSAQCLIEQYQFSKELQVSVNASVFLRDDIPCDPKCLTNATLVRINRNNLRNPCWGCVDGKPRSWEKFLKHPNSYVNSIPDDTIAIVIGSGTWYNNFKGLIDSTAVYTDTIRKLRPIVKSWVRERNIMVFWQGLPPVNPEHIKQLNGSDYFGWSMHYEKDRIAKSILEPVGAIFVNVSALSKDRKQLDVNISSDYIHWCNPGAFSVPSFLNQVYFHLIAKHYLVSRTSL